MTTLTNIQKEELSEIIDKYSLQILTVDYRLVKTNVNLIDNDISDNPIPNPCGCKSCDDGDDDENDYPEDKLTIKEYKSIEEYKNECYNKIEAILNDKVIRMLKTSYRIMHAIFPILDCIQINEISKNMNKDIKEIIKCD